MNKKQPKSVLPIAVSIKPKPISKIKKIVSNLIKRPKSKVYLERNISISGLNKKNLSINQKRILKLFKQGVTEKVYFKPGSNKLVIYLNNKDQDIGSIECNISKVNGVKYASISWTEVDKQFQGVGLFGQMLAEAEDILRKEGVLFLSAHVIAGDKTYSLHGYTRGKADFPGVWFYKKLN